MVGLTPPSSPSAHASAAPPALAPLPPPSIASFSFSQFLSPWEEDVGASDAAVRRHCPGASPSRSSPASIEPLAAAPTLSFEDCVHFKLCLTCALCGRLLRHHPAVIETCGHCFCYDCINSVVEEGCVPLVRQWPWNRLSQEVESAAARWAKASCGHSSCTGEKGSEEGTDNEEDEVVVTGVTPERPAAKSPAAAKPRKVRQKCPLCLGPAFKWMLVSVPPVAELCAQIAASYPALEQVLQQLSEPPPSLSPGVPSAASSAEKQKEAAMGEVDSGLQATSVAATQADVAAAAFAMRVTSASAAAAAPPHATSQDAPVTGPSQTSSGDEEAERRRRRSSGAPRKEITFADEVRASTGEVPPPVAPPPPPPALSSSASASSTESSQNEALREVPLSSIDFLSGEAREVALAAPRSSSSLSLSSIAAAALQMSFDLIPSPSTTAAVAPSKTTTARRLAWSEEASLHNENVTNMAAEPRPSLDGILGPSPPSDHRDLIEAAGTRNGQSCAAMASALSSADFTAPSQVPYLSGTLQDAEGEDEELLLTPAIAPRVRGCVLLDDAFVSEEAEMRWRPTASSSRSKEADAAQWVSRLAAAGYAVVYDGTETKGGEEASPMPTTATSRAYSAVRGEHNAAAVVSVHLCDAWELDAAHLQRHPRFPHCYVALRAGQLAWRDAGKKFHQTSTPKNVALSYVACRNTSAHSQRLSPAACTAAVLRVPCVDVSRLCPDSGSEGGDASFCPLWSTASPSSIVAPRGALWMSHTRDLLLARLPSPCQSHTTHKATSTGQAFTASSPVSCCAQCFFVLPDEAVRHVVHRLNGRREAVSLLAFRKETTDATASRKRGRDDSDVDGRRDNSEGWDTTDGHPQAAWRRLLLASGAATVEISASFLAVVLTAALSEDTAANGSSDEEEERNREAASLIRCLDAASHTATTTMDNWVHVDVGQCNQSATTTAAEPPRLIGAPSPHHHALFLLYSPEAARRSCEQYAANVVPNALSPISTAESQEAASPDAVHAVLRRVAALIALVVAPAFPGLLSVVSDARPASWLLESIVGSDDSLLDAAGEASGKEHDSPVKRADKGSLVTRAEGLANTLESQERQQQSMTWTAAKAKTAAAQPYARTAPVLPPATPSPLSSESQDLPQRIGFYRNCLYSDTP